MLSQLTELFESKPSEKNKEMHRLFKDLPENEKVIDDYSCALAKEILIQGRLYLTQNWLCFYSNIFTIENKLTIPFAQVTAVTKERTALVIPNAITISTNTAKYGFSSFVSRDIVHAILMLIWQNSSLERPSSPIHLYSAARKAWGVHMPQVSSEEELWGSISRKPRHTLSQSSQQISLELSNSNEVRIEEGSSSPVATITVQNSPDIIPVIRQDVTPPILVSTSAPTILTAQPDPPPLHTPEERSLSSGELNVPHDLYSTTSGDSRQSEIDVSGFYTDLETTYIEKTYPYPTGKIFKLIFLEGTFITDFMQSRKASEFTFGNWERNSLGGKVRNIRYRLALNYSIGPRSCMNTEEQIMSPSTQQNTVYLIDVLIRNHNIPYCDNFHCVTRYLLVRTGKAETFVKITGKIIFTKINIITPKSFIEKNVLDGLVSYFQNLGAALSDWIERFPHETRRSNRSARKRENRVKTQSSQPQDVNSPLSSPRVITSPLLQTAPLDNLNSNSPSFFERNKYHILLAALSLLLIFMFYFMFLRPPRTEFQRGNTFNWPANEKDWITLVLKQHRAYENDLGNIQQYFDTILSQMEETVKTIKLMRKLTEGIIMQDALACITDPNCSEEELNRIANIQKEN